MHKSGDHFELSDGFKESFPHTNFLTMLEWTTWAPSYYTSEATVLHEIALQIRRIVLGQHHEAVLQGLIICGSIHRSLASQTKAASYFYDACMLSKAIKKFQSITITCSTIFLEVTETLTSTTRTEIITHKEEVRNFSILIESVGAKGSRS